MNMFDNSNDNDNDGGLFRQPQAHNSVYSYLLGMLMEQHPMNTTRSDYHAVYIKPSEEVTATVQRNGCAVRVWYSVMLFGADEYGNAVLIDSYMVSCFTIADIMRQFEKQKLLDFSTLPVAQQLQVASECTEMCVKLIKGLRCSPIMATAIYAVLYSAWRMQFDEMELDKNVPPERAKKIMDELAELFTWISRNPEA